VSKETTRNTICPKFIQLIGFIGFIGFIWKIASQALPESWLGKMCPARRPVNLEPPAKWRQPVGSGALFNLPSFSSLQDSPKKLRPLVCKGRTRPVSQVSPPGDENLDAADCQSPTAVLLSLVNTDLMHTVHTDFEPREESFRFEKSKENGFRFDKRDEIPVMASINCHSSSEFNIIPKKNSNAPRKKRPKRPLQSGSGISEGANNAPNKWRSYVCKICNRYFQYPRSLLTHQLVHQDVRPHKCTFPSCSKAFRQTGHLQTHLLIHTGDKPFRCPVQGEFFFTFSIWFQFSKFNGVFEEKIGFFLICQAVRLFRSVMPTGDVRYTRTFD
jgi:Zinc finger, C2H2 type